MALNPPAGFVWELDLTYSEDNPKVILREKDLLVHIASEHDLCDFKKKSAIVYCYSMIMLIIVYFVYYL